MLLKKGAVLIALDTIDGLFDEPGTGITKDKEYVLLRDVDTVKTTWAHIAQNNGETNGWRIKLFKPKSKVMLPFFL